MKVYLWMFVVMCLFIVQVTCRRRRRRSTCATHPRLRDKWHFLDESKRVYVRIRAHHVVHKHGSTKVIKYKCVENIGNIYLLRKRKYKNTDDGVLCLGFSYIADHPKAEYVVLRLIGPGEGSHLLSPVIKPGESDLSIDNTCDLEGDFVEDHKSYTTNAFLRRAPSTVLHQVVVGPAPCHGSSSDGALFSCHNVTQPIATSTSSDVPGCKFPQEIQGRWNFTYQHAKMLEIWQRNATLHLMSGQDVRFFCDKRDGNVFVFRAKEFVSKDEDAIMCAEFTPLPEDPFYKFQMSRHNSGNLLDGQLKSVQRSRPVYVHMDCDWIGSPARPEFLYP